LFPIPSKSKTITAADELLAITKDNPAANTENNIFFKNQASSISLA